VFKHYNRIFWKPRKTSKTIFKVGHLALLIKAHQHFHIPRQSFNILVRKEAPLEFLIHVKSFLFYARWKKYGRKTTIYKRALFEISPFLYFLYSMLFSFKNCVPCFHIRSMPQSLPWGFYTFESNFVRI
jgi:hypothetical protein